MTDSQTLVGQTLASQILTEIEPLGTESYRKVLRNHGITGPLYGVKISDLKPYQRKFRKDYRLAKDLFATGVYDAMYLAGLIADERAMTPEDLKGWLAASDSDQIAEYAVAWVAADGAHGWTLALEWIEVAEERSVVAGWGTLSALVSVKQDSELDMAALRALLERVRTTIHDQPDRVRYKMNGFVIALGSYVAELHEEALKVGEELGTLMVDMGNTACKVPYSPDYIRKVAEMGRVGKKRKTARC